MNNQNMMMPREDPRLIDARAAAKEAEARKKAEEQALANTLEAVNGGMMVRRDSVPQASAPSAVPEKNAEPEAPERRFEQGSQPENGQPQAAPQGQPKARSAADITKAASAAQQQARQQVESEKKQAPAAKPAETRGGQQASSPAPPKISVPSTIRTSMQPDVLAKRYADMFQSHFGMALSPVLCYENMRRICEPDIKDPAGTLWLIENTYRLSTLLYLTGNLPIMVIATILAEKNRKNVLKYVTAETENAAKPHDELWKLRTGRWARKYESMAANDAITVTPGATLPTPELSAAMAARFEDVCGRMKKFDRDLSKAVAKLDGAALNDVSYIYSNCWYFLQGFENVPEMRSYVMAITDDTRRNLKI